ncbi:MAG: sensor domain-containing diguanylate cyclase [Deltaproteobacteria bacterium]|nr:sensor domain-containing diguanylate cyclase [Myxococcales bacterium]MDP3220103.1 sensor domain-containing diguanylate cyclase [Deltaproteobacteria bacterium]
MSDVDALVAQLERDNEALLDFLYLCPLAIAQLDGEGGVEMMNPAGARIFMTLSAEPEITNLLDVLAPFAPTLRASVADLTATAGTICENQRIEVGQRAPGQALPLVLTLTLIKLNATKIMAVAADVSRSAAQERAAQATEVRFRAVLDGVRDYAIFAVDLAGRVETWNKSAERLFGYAAEEVLGRDHSMLLARTHQPRERSAALLQGATAQGWAEDEGWWGRKESTRFWGNCVLSVAEDADGRPVGFTHIVRDLTRRKRNEDALRSLAHTDPLTGATNRRGFDEALAAEFRRWGAEGEPFCLIMLDADHFKRVNDLHGHPGGDAVLVALAHACRDQLRECDLFARVGGEEFALLLPATDRPGGRAAAERVRVAVESLRVAHGADTIRFTVSLGVAQVGPAGATPEGLVALADAALYEAKRRGRNRVVLAPAPDP